MLFFGKNPDSVSCISNAGTYGAKHRGELRLVARALWSKLHWSAKRKAENCTLWGVRQTLHLGEIQFLELIK